MILKVAVRFSDEVSLKQAIEQLTNTLMNGDDDITDFAEIGALMNSGEPIPDDVFLAQLLEADA